MPQLGTPTRFSNLLQQVPVRRAPQSAPLQPESIATRGANTALILNQNTLTTRFLVDNFYLSNEPYASLPYAINGQLVGQHLQTRPIAIPTAIAEQIAADVAGIPRGDAQTAGHRELARLAHESGRYAPADFNNAYIFASDRNLTEVALYAALVKADERTYNLALYHHFPAHQGAPMPGHGVHNLPAIAAYQIDLRLDTTRHLRFVAQGSHSKARRFSPPSFLTPVFAGVLAGVLLLGWLVWALAG